MAVHWYSLRLYVAGIDWPKPAMISTPISASKLSTSVCLSPVFPPLKTDPPYVRTVSKQPNLPELVAISMGTFRKELQSRLNTTIDHHLPTWIVSTLLLIAGSENPAVCRE